MGTAAADGVGTGRSAADVIAERLIICLASRWDIDPTSKHHVMRILARHNDVLWVNYHGSRRPRLTRGDAQLVLDGLRRVTRRCQPVSGRLHQLTPLVIPGCRKPTLRWVNRALLMAQIRAAVRRIRRHRDQPVQLWSFAPDVDGLPGAFGEEGVIYYCVDEYSAFAGFDPAAMLRAERRLMAAADVVLTSSATLHANRVDLHPRVHLVRHGVEHAHFARALDQNLPVPDPLRRLRPPLALFAGLIQHWLDLDLLAATARLMPDVNFVMVGDRRVDTGRLDILPNVHFVGRRPYGELPAYCAASALGLIPFVRSHLTENVNPIKLREYLAAGLPVVSTDLPEVRRFAPHVRTAGDVVQFAAACRQALADNTPAARAVRSRAVAGEDWEVVVARVADLVEGALRPANPWPPGGLSESPHARGRGPASTLVPAGA